MMHIPNIKALGLVVSDKKIFSCFPIYQGHNLNNVVEIHEVMLHTKYQGSRPCYFQTRRFSHVFLI